MRVNITYPKFKDVVVTDGSLQYAAGYKVYAFEAESVPSVGTAVDTYSDSACTVANTWPVVLDSTGLAQIYVKDDVKLVYSTPTGDYTSPIWTVDHAAVQFPAPTVGAATPVTANNNYVVTTSPGVTSLSDVSIFLMTPDIDNTDTLTSNVFTGTGINDCTEGGAYIGTVSGAVFTIVIDNLFLASPGAPTAVLSGTAGIVTTGNHYVKVTFVNAAGESLPGTASAVVNADGSHKIDLTDISLGTADVTSRKIYMTEAAGTDYYYVDEIADNTTTTYAINVADASLTVAAPTDNTSYDTFKWKKDGGAYTEGVAITGAEQNLSEGITLLFASDVGHTVGDLWAITVETPARVALDGLTNLIVYKNKGGSIVAVDGGDMKAGYTAQLIPNTSLNAWLLINPATPTFDTPTITAVRNRKNLTTTYSQVIGDEGYELSCIGTFTITLLTPPEFANRFCYIKNAGTGLVTIDAGAAYLIHGYNSRYYYLAPNAAIQLLTNGIDWHVIASTGGLQAVSKQSLSAAASATFTDLIPGIRYKLVYTVKQNTARGTHYLRFNADGGNNYANRQLEFLAIGVVTSVDGIYLSLDSELNSWTQCTVEFQTAPGDDTAVLASGFAAYSNAGTWCGSSITGYYNGAAALTSVTLYTSGVGATLTGDITLYAYA